MSLREKLLLRLHLSTKSTRKFQTDDEISLQRFSRASSVNDPTAAENDENNSASYNSLNSITTILSNDNLNLFNLNQTKLMTAARLEQPNIILNYSLLFEERRRALVVNIISLEHEHMPVSLTSSSAASSASHNDLNVYVKLEILPPKEVTMASMNANGSSQSSLASLPKISAKTRLIRNKSSPIYNETFELENLGFIYDQLPSSSNANNNNTVVPGSSNEVNLFKCFRLVFNVCNSNLFGRDQIIGQTVHNLLREDCLTASAYKRVMEGSLKDSGENSVSEQSFSRIYSKKVDLVVDARVCIFIL
jgi:hypothetical protein